MAESSKKLGILLIASFLLFITTPLLLGVIGINSETKFKFNTKEGLKSFPKQFEAFFNSNFGLRRFFISSFYFVKIKVLQERVVGENTSSVNITIKEAKPNSPSSYSVNSVAESPTFKDSIQVNKMQDTSSFTKKTPNSEGKKYKTGQFKEDYSVIAGKKDWLFYAPTTDGYGLEDFKGRIILTQEELLKIKATLEEQRNWLRKKGIKYLVVICPNKQTIYPEYLPEWIVKEKGSSTVQDQITSYLSKNSDIEIVDLRKTLLNQKTKNKKNLYYKTDTHWNQLGTFYAYQEIMKHIIAPDSMDLPVRLIDYKITYIPRKGGDISAMIGLEDFYDDTEISFTLKKKVQKKLKSAFVSHDSYYIKLEPFFKASFDTIQNVPFFENNFDYERIERFNPEIFVYEIVERYQGIFMKDNPPEIK